MKYNIGDKIRIRKDLVVNDDYGNDTYVRKMDDVAKKNDYVLVIDGYEKDNTKYVMVEDKGDYFWTDEMIEGLADLTDREKFEGWIRKLSSLDFYDTVWDAFNFTVTSEPNEKGYEDNLKVVSDYLFGAKKKKMTKAEIEKELGYEIEIVKEEISDDLW